MSIKTFDSALDFVPATKPANGGVLKSILSVFGAIREGIDLAGQYKDLTNRGMASDEAARQVFNQINKVQK